MGPCSRPRSRAFPFSWDRQTHLRARRTWLRPEDVGLEPGPRRRVAGLRREELALLAGVSADYYQRMEQGRDVQPSDQVLDARARPRFHRSCPPRCGCCGP
nr:helix-turn-helix transcriptional regulator [Streptomyces paludis]